MSKTLSTLFEEFIFECEYARRLNPKTLELYKNVFKTFIKLCPHVDLNSLSSHAVAQFFSLLQNRERIVGKGQIKVGIKTSTIATYWSKLNVFFKWLETKGHIQANPFLEMTYPRPSYENKKFLSKKDIEKIITAVITNANNSSFLLKRNLLLLHLLLFCGIRRSELLHIQLRDIDIDKKIVTIRVATSKSKRSRDIPLHSQVMMHLKDYLKERKKYTTPYLLVSRNRDDRLTSEGLRHLIEKLQRSSGVQFHVHQFRHTFAVNFLKQSNNITKLKQLLGHKNILMTLTYLRCLPTSELRGDIEGMGIDSLI